MIDGFERPAGRDVTGQRRDVIGPGTDLIEMLASLLQAGVFADAPGIRRGGPIDHAALGNPVLNHQDPGDVAIMLQGVTDQMHHVELQLVAVLVQALG